MAGQIKKMIDHIIQERSGGNQTMINTTRTKLQLKGIDINKYTETSPDDRAVIDKLQDIAKQLNVVLK